MAETALAAELAAERAEAIRSLLARPLIDASQHPEAFADVARHGPWLTDWFESSCGWRLTVDRQGSFARLHKRRRRPDPTRPIRRARGAMSPFDRRRLELFCRICAELISPPITTLGLLAQRLEAATVDRPTRPFDTSRRRERSAFVDCVLALVDLGAITVDGGHLDAFIDNPDENAFIRTDVSRLHALLSTDTPPSRLTDVDAGSAADTLLAEPRFAVDDTTLETDDRRNRRLRQSIGRRLLDDPVVYRHDLTDEEQNYFDSLSGRQWLRARVEAAGMRLELRAEGALAIEPLTEATDLSFPAPNGNVWQMALLLVDQFVVDSGDRRRLMERTRTQVTAAVSDLLRAHPTWAKKYRTDGGPQQLAGEAVDVLAAFGLVRCHGDLIEPLPAIARYRVGKVNTSSPSLFDPEDC